MMPNTLVSRGVPVVSRGLLWGPVVSRWCPGNVPVVFRDVPWCHVVSRGLLWTPVVSRGLPWSPVVPSPKPQSHRPFVKWFYPQVLDPCGDDDDDAPTIAPEKLCGTLGGATCGLARNQK